MQHGKEAYLKTRILALSAVILILVSNISCGKSSTAEFTPTPRPTQTIAPLALSYLNEALDLIQKYSYYRKIVNWNVLRNEAYQLGSRANTTDETYAAINLVFQKIGDRHGGINKPYKANMPTPYPSFERSVGKLLEGRVGYILVPGSDISDTTVADEYVASMHGEIKKIDQSHPCGWIVDLRGNPGGWYSPMEVGIGPILGEGILGGPINADGKITHLTYQDGIGRLGNEIEFKVDSPYHMVVANPPVAILTDSGTDSAAEVLAIVFRGRPDTRSFGQPTGGHNPGMGKVISLDDRGILWITTELMTDRTGKIYPEAPIQPDAVVPLPDDKTIPQAAMDWLLSQSRCNAPQDITPSP